MRVVVTGNLGYVGTVMTPIIAAAGHEVWGLDTGYYRGCILGDLGETGLSRQIDRDVRRVTAEDLRGADAVIHLAALSNDPTGELNPGLTSDINYEASVRIAGLCKQVGISRYIFASSCSIYGQSDAGALTEDAEFNPQTAYARSKVDTEAAVSALADDEFSPTFMRNATAYGFSPRLRLDVVVNNLTGWAVTTNQVRLLSDGRAWRPLVHVEDMSYACAAALAVPRERVHNEALNVGREEDNYQIRSIAETVAEIVPNCVVTFAEGASADNRNYNVCFSKIRRVLPEFEPRWNVRKGIEQLYRAYTETDLNGDRFGGREFTRLKQLQHLLDTTRVNDSLYWL